MTLSKTVLMFAVLIGLLFSCGEGVQLLPFPVPEAAGDPHSNINSKNKIPYQFSIHRFENDRGDSHTKSQPNASNHFWTKAGILAGGLIFNVYKNWRGNNFPPNPDFLKSNLFLSSRGSRAPPIS